MLVWFGLLCGVAIGVGAVAVFLLRERRNGQALNGPINIWNVGSGAQLPSAPQQLALPPMGSVMDASPDPGLKNKMSTVTLSATAANRLMRASGGRRWAVQARTVGPPGAYAIFSTDVDQTSGAEAGPSSIVIPAGDSHFIDLEAGDYLFARGSTNGVVVSYTARQLA